MTTATVKEVNYTPEQTTDMVNKFLAAPCKATVEALAVAMGKSTRSIISKLSREKVYQKPAYVTKTGEKVQKKDETADAIGAVLRMTEPEIESLTKANKTALVKIWKAVSESKPIEGMDGRETASMNRVSGAALAAIAAGTDDGTGGMGEGFQRGEPLDIEGEAE